jgi:hypothetical protein
LRPGYTGFGNREGFALAGFLLKSRQSTAVLEFVLLAAVIALIFFASVAAAYFAAYFYYAR